MRRIKSDKIGDTPCNYLKIKELRLNCKEIPALRPGWQLGKTGWQLGKVGMATAGGEAPISVVDLFRFWR